MFIFKKFEKMKKNEVLVETKIKIPGPRENEVLTTKMTSLPIFQQSRKDFTKKMSRNKFFHPILFFHSFKKSRGKKLKKSCKMVTEKS